MGSGAPGIGRTSESDVEHAAEAARGLPRVLALARNPLYRNAYALVANQVSSAALGFVYWLLAARLYPVEVVGRSSAMISVLLLIAALAQLGLGSGMVRFVPRAGRHTRKLILTAYAVVPTAAVVLSVGFLRLAHVLRLDEKLAGGDLPPGLLVLATILWSVFYFQDGILNGLRQSVWVLIENFLYNAAKIVMLVVGVWLLKDAGIVGSWFLPTPFAIALVAWLVFRRFLRAGRLGRDAEDGEPLTVREVVTSVSGDHLGSVISEAAVRVLPLLVVALLGPTQNAYFYQAWLVATTLSLTATGMSLSFTAQAAGDRENISAYSRKILAHMFLLLAPVALLIAAAAPLVLAMFGGDYGRAAPLLRWLALTAPIVVFNTWYLAYARVAGRIGRVVAMQATSSVLLLGLAYAMLPALGVTGVGIAWLASQAAVAAAAFADARQVLWEPSDRALRPDVSAGGHSGLLPPSPVPVPAAGPVRTPSQAPYPRVDLLPGAIRERARPGGDAAVAYGRGRPYPAECDALFVSPHLDDAVLSCGGAIARLARSGARVMVATVCTADPPGNAPLSTFASRIHAGWDLGDAPFGPRCLEDEEALRLFGARLEHLGLLDAVYRSDGEGRPLYRRSVGVPIDPRDVYEFLSRLRPRLKETLDASPAARVFCPGGVGGHVDHLLVKRSVEELCDPRRIVYYEEYPYLSARKTAPVSTDGDDWRRAVLELTPLELESRIEAIACYRSQVRGLFPNRIERVCEIVSAHAPALGPWLLGPDEKPARERVRRHVRRDVTACGGERYWVPAGSPSPFPMDPPGPDPR